jgi:hypothetical protein
VLTLLGAAALVALAVVLTNQGPTCGGLAMSGSDECYIGNSDTPASYTDMANSPLPSIVFAAAVGLVGWLVMHTRRENKPTASEIRAFERYVDRRRAELRAAYESTPAYQRTWSTPEELVARLDQRVRRERKRKGFGETKTKGKAKA